MKLNKDTGSRAVYIQIIEMVKRVIVKGETPPGTKIMSIEKFATNLGVAPNTVAMAYTKLVKEGLLYAKKGTGFFITKDKNRIESERQKLILQYAERFGEDIKACLSNTFTQQRRGEEVARILNKVQAIILSQ